MDNSTSYGYDEPNRLIADGGDDSNDEDENGDDEEALDAGIDAGSPDPQMGDSDVVEQGERLPDDREGMDEDRHETGDADAEADADSESEDEDDEDSEDDGSQS